VGIIIGFLGVSQLGPLGAVYVPGMVVVAHFRELGPLVTAIVVAGRSGAGLASEIATMKVSEEIDALRSLGFDPVRWLIVPRCLARPHGASFDLDRRPAGIGWWSDSHDSNHEHDAPRIYRGDQGPYHCRPSARRGTSPIRGHKGV